MQRVTAAYREEQNEYLRNENYVWVYLGIISKEAQANAKSIGQFTSYSAPQSVFSDNKFEAYYAIPEENFIKTDGSQYFIPRQSELFGLWQGLVTQELNGSVIFSFAPYTKLDLKGLTIDFGDYYPTELEVTNGNVTYTYIYTNDKPGQWICEDVFYKSSFIKITPRSMVGGRQRLRILSIMFGVGLMFDNKTLISTSWKQECSHLSDKLPSKQFSFTIDNLNKKFAADDPHSFTHFLKREQKIEFSYGRKLKDDSIYTIKGGDLFLKTWSSTDTQAKFTAVGFLDYQSGTYKKGKYYPNGISLWQLAVDVCEDAGIENYTIDNYLKTLYTHNPLPVQTHKNLLQCIASASQSIMRETRRGALEIKSSFEPDITNISSNSETVYSVVQNVVDEQIAASDYATSEKDYTHADSIQYFVPRTSRQGYVETGYISGSVSKQDGTFITNPTITIEWEAAWTFFDLALVFGDVIPEEFVVRIYNFGTLIDTITQDEIEYFTNVEYDFYDINKMVIEFTKAKPFNRIHIKKIRFGKLTDYSIDYVDMKTSPIAATAELVRNVNVNYYEYAYGGENKKLGTVKAVVGENEITFTKPSHGYSLAYANGESGTLTILESGAYYIKFSSTRETDVDIMGYEFLVTTKTITNPLHDLGTDKTVSNVLVDNFDRASEELGWVSDYFDNDIDYTITYRGEPALDADDLIYIENKYVERNLIRISSTQIDTSTGMSMNCKIKARRVSYIEPALVDVAIVDESEVY